MFAGSQHYRQTEELPLKLTQRRIRVSTMISSSLLFDLPRRGRSGGLAKCLLDVLLEYVLADQAKFVGHDFAGTIDEEIHRQPAVSTVEFNRVFCSQQDRIVHAHFLSEGGDHLVAYFRVHVDSHYLESLRSILFLEISKP